MTYFIQLCTVTNQKLDAFAQFVAQRIAWLTVIMVLVTSGIVLVRQLFNLNSLAAQESVTYMHALVLMVAMAYTLKEQGHVRVDIFYRGYSPLKKAWVDLLGSILFLLPFAVITFIISWGFVEQSWGMLEGSGDAGGIQGVYLLKSLLLVNSVLLALQAVSEIARNLIVITLKDETDHD